MAGSFDGARAAIGIYSPSARSPRAIGFAPAKTGEPMEARDERSRAGDDASGRGPLTGIRVIELADEQAEYCGLTLAGLGADVIKVEPPGGNATRRIGPFYQDREDLERSLFFWQYNRGKRSIVLDLGRPADRERFR